MSNQEPYSGGWSEWYPTEDPAIYARSRQDENGSYQHEYHNTLHADPAVPRGDDVSGLESAFGNVSLNDPYPQYAYNEGSYGYSDLQGVATTPQGQTMEFSMPSSHGHAASSSRKGKAVDSGTKTKKSSRDVHKDREKKALSSKKSKQEKGRVDFPPPDPFYLPLDPLYPLEEPTDPHTSYPSPPGRAKTIEEPYPSENLGTTSTGPEASGDPYNPPAYSAFRQVKGKHAKASSSARRKQSSSDYPEYPSEGAEYDETVDPYHPGPGAMDDEPGGLTPRAGTPRTKANDGSTHSGYYCPPNPSDAYASGSGNPYPTSPDDLYSAHPDNPYSAHSDNPYTTDPSAAGPEEPYPPIQYPHLEPRHEEIQGTATSVYGDFDGRYVIEQSSRYMPGEVFKILWSEPRGGTAIDDLSSIEEREQFYIGYRRFIVVANDEGHCTCVPILTYERRACTKKGVKPQKHGIVYATNGRPYKLSTEPDLGFPPVRVQLDYPTEKLAKESRVNYSKLVTVEHNVSVFFIGRIVAEDFDIVTNAVDRCWSAKKRAGGESSHHKRRHPH